MVGCKRRFKDFLQPKKIQFSFIFYPLAFFNFLSNVRKDWKWHLRPDISLKIKTMSLNKKRGGELAAWSRALSTCLKGRGIKFWSFSFFYYCDHYQCETDITAVTLCETGTRANRKKNDLKSKTIVLVPCFIISKTNVLFNKIIDLCISWQSSCVKLLCLVRAQKNK